MFNFIKDKEKGKTWFGGKCETAKKKRNEALKRIKRKSIHNIIEQYKLERNEYVRVRREDI